MQARREDHETFFCPNGHRQHFPGQTQQEKTIERLKKRVDSYEKSLTWYRNELNDERRAHSATKGQRTKARRALASMTVERDQAYARLCDWCGICFDTVPDPAHCEIAFPERQESSDDA